MISSLYLYTYISYNLSILTEEIPDHTQHSPFGILAPCTSNRETFVQAAIKFLIDRRVIVLRAPPFPGKSTLLSLIGAEILRNHEDLEPMMIFLEPSVRRRDFKKAILRPSGRGA